MDAINKITGFSKLNAINPPFSWDDIQVGEVYHIPPLFFYKRKDFIVLRKEDRYIKVKFDGESFTSSIYKNDVVSKFIVKKWSL